MAPIPTAAEAVFPSLHCCTKLADGQSLYDIKFYPYPTIDDDQLFAVAGERDIFVCRPKLGDSFELLRWFKDPDASKPVADSTKHAYNSVVWTRHPVTRKPLLCIAGVLPKQIQFIDVESGVHLSDITLSGHGKGINDLAISPLSTSILASAAEDYTVRLWNLEPAYAKQPCVAIFAGEAHKQPTLACHFHPNGRWMLTSGLDTAVCLWAVPSLKELDRKHDDEEEADPKVVYYPHFLSTEVHANYVDSLAFYGDLIISRSAKHQVDRSKDNAILLWKIVGFESEANPPSNPPIPSPGVFTRSSFEHPKQSRGFQRLLTFDMPDTGLIYLRFSLLHTAGMRPILAMGNEKSKFHFWDLQKLEEGYDASEVQRTRKSRGGRKPKKGVATAAVNKSNLDRFGELRREQSGPSDATCPSSTSVSATPERKFDLSDPFMSLKPHHQVVANTTLSPNQHFATRQIAWSPNGTWMVAVGDNGMMCIFNRDKSVV
ncbi:hypothetical protein LTR08_004908 [Meristemomyces frigidus]|nr:hypothetical protein LTR08_004908 [Meristemomyces frigidus]